MTNGHSDLKVQPALFYCRWSSLPSIDRHHHPETNYNRVRTISNCINWPTWLITRYWCPRHVKPQQLNSRHNTKAGYINEDPQPCRETLWVVPPPWSPCPCRSPRGNSCNEGTCTPPFTADTAILGPRGQRWPAVLEKSCVFQLRFFLKYDHGGMGGPPNLQPCFNLLSSNPWTLELSIRNVQGSKLHQHV